MLKRAGVLAALTLLATASGLAREAVAAYALGTSATADAMAVAVFLVDLVNALFLTGGLGYALVPTIQRLRRTGGDATAHALVGAVVARLVLLAAAICLIALAVPRVAARASLGPVDSAVAAHTIALLRGGLVAVAIMAPAGALGAALYAFDRFGVAAWARLGWNAVAALALIALVSLPPLVRAETALVLASLTALGIVAAAFLGPAVRPTLRLTHPALGTVMAAAAPGVVAVIFGNALLGLWERSLLGQLGPGSISVANYAQRASYAASILSLSVHTVAFNSIVTALHSGGGAAVTHLVGRLLRRTLLLLGPLVAVMVIARVEIVALLYGRGAFDPASVRLTADLFGLFSLDVMLVFIMGLLLRVMYALERPWAAALPTIVSAVIAAAADTALIGRFGERAIPIGYGVGLIAGIGTAVAQIRRLAGVRLLGWIARSAALSAGLALVGGTLAWAGARLLLPGDAESPAGVVGAGWRHAAALGGTVVVNGLLAAAAVLALAAVLRVKEVSELVTWLRDWRDGRQPQVT
ncbi:MAG TPA: lipid II flippase MurJ [Gemmatimonadaceae bacterium]|nr:lipid II flippase MurJ [Gemmatimonadaceae bacterium]